MATALACPACRTGMLARRGDPLCPSCAKEAQEMADRPLWLFDSPLLRRALAEVNLPAVPAIVRAACGLSQRDLAAIVGWSGAALSYYERGRRDGMFDVRAVLLFADAVGMPRSAVLPLILADPEVGPAGGGPGAGPTGSVAATEAATALPLAGVPRGVSGSDVRYWRACRTALYAQDRAAGAAAMLEPALQQWRRVRLALREAGTGEIGGQALAAAGEVALCAGWIALNAGCPQVAMRLNASAGSRREPARRALHLAFQAQEEGRYLPMPQLHAFVALRHADAAALLGDKNAFRAAITRARRELGRGSADDDPPEWPGFAGETEITAAEARGYLNLGEASRSVLLYRQVLAACASAGDRALHGAGLACALVKQGALRGAVTAAMEVLPVLEAGVASMRCIDRLRLVRRAVGNNVGAREFCARFDAVERVLTAPQDQPGDDGTLVTASIPALRDGGSVSNGVDSNDVMLVFLIEKTFRFEAAHHLDGLPDGHKCASTHGHSYVVAIELASADLDDTGFVTDFSDLDLFGEYIKATFDHKYLNLLRATVPDGQETGPLLPQPSSECLARHLYEAAMRILPCQIAPLVTAVRVSETETARATYVPGGMP